MILRKLLENIKNLGRIHLYKEERDNLPSLYKEEVSQFFLGVLGFPRNVCLGKVRKPRKPKTPRVVNNEEGRSLLPDSRIPVFLYIKKRDTLTSL